MLKDCGSADGTWHKVTDVDLYSVCDRVFRVSNYEFSFAPAHDQFLEEVQLWLNRNGLQRFADAVSPSKGFVTLRDVKERATESVLSSSGASEGEIAQFLDLANELELRSAPNAKKPALTISIVEKKSGQVQELTLDGTSTLTFGANQDSAAMMAGPKIASPHFEIAFRNGTLRIRVLVCPADCCFRNRATRT